MDIYTKRKLKTAAGMLIFADCIGLVLLGQRTVGWGYLAVMLLGLAGIIALLYFYNRGVEHPPPVGGLADSEEKNGNTEVK